MTILIDSTRREVTRSESPIGFSTTGDANWPVWDRYLTVDGKQAYHLGNICNTCAFLFQRMNGANNTIKVGALAGKLAAGLDRLEPDVIDSLALLMPDGRYRALLLRLTPYRVTIGTNDDYFAYEQIENDGVDLFYGFPHHPRVRYYRSERRRITPPAGTTSGRDDGVLFEFLIPMFAENWLETSRIADYQQAIANGRTPTAVAISVLDVKGPAEEGDDHWCLAHYLLDGHHKAAAAAQREQPITLISFLAVEQGISTENEIEAALAELRGARS
jgi:hypothetical protein